MLTLLSGDKEIIVADARDSSTIGQIKAMISAKEGIPLDRMALEYAGSRLQNDQPLSAYRVPPAEYLNVIVDDSDESGEPRPSSEHEDPEDADASGEDTAAPEASHMIVPAEAADNGVAAEEGVASRADVVKELMAKWTTVYDGMEGQEVHV